jgi:nitrite reductase (NO-forming)
MNRTVLGATLALMTGGTPGQEIYGRLWRAPVAELSLKTETTSTVEHGQVVFGALCAACHQTNAQGLPGAFPPLAKSDYLMADKKRDIGVVLKGLMGPVTVNGATYRNVMPPQAQLSDADVAAVLTYVRTHFGNEGEPVTAAEVAETRAGGANTN